MSQSAVVTGAGGAERIRLREDSRARWRDIVTEWEQYVDEKENQSLVFVGDGERNKDEFLTVPYSHRFTDEYTSMQYARLMDFCRGAQEEYDDPYIAFLTLTASTTTPAGNLRPPLDHLDELLSSWDRGVRYELTHTMKADRQKDEYEPLDYEYLQIREPTTDNGSVPGGYAHIHPVVVFDGKPERKRLERVIDKHVEKCDWATAEAHPYDECIDIRPFDEIANLGAYLFKYLGKSWGGSLKPYQRRFNAMLWETGRRRFQPSEGAQRWMQPEDEYSGMSWMFVGVGEDEKVAELMQYDDVGEFQVAKETGVRSWLNQREAPESVDVGKSVAKSDGAVWLEDKVGCDRGSDHEFVDGECLKCGVPVGAFIKGIAG